VYIYHNRSSLSFLCKLLITRCEVAGIEVSADLHDFETKVPHVFVSECSAFEGFDNVVDAFGEG
jgi:hypothetical protein